MKRSFITILGLSLIFGGTAYAAPSAKSSQDPKKKIQKDTKTADLPKKKVQEPKTSDSGPQVKKFEFTGIRRTPRELLKQISSKYIQSSLYGDWNEKMIQEIERIPIVRSAHLMRDMMGNITIQITEREPIAYLFLDQYYWMDEQAHVIQTIDNKDLEDKVFFSGPWKNPADYEKKNGDIVLMEGVRFYSQLLAAGIEEKKISEIHFDANLGWIMYRVGSRAPIVFGTQNLSQKIERYVQILPQLGPLEGSISRIDADFNDRVVVKKIGEE